MTAAEKALEEKAEALAAADGELAIVDKQLSQKENRVEKLAEKEKDIQGRIKSIEDGGQLLTLKQIENIPTKIHAPTFGKTGVILFDEDYNNLRTTAMTAAKATEEVNKYKRIARAAVEAIWDIIQAVTLLKFNFKGNAEPVNNLTPEQDILITAIRRHGIDFSRSHGYNKAADEMKKATMGKPISEIFYEQEKEYKNKNTPSILEAATQKAREHNEQNNNAPNRSQGRKNHGVDL